MFNFIHAMPLWSAKVGATLLFGSIVLFSWFMPKEFIYKGAPDRARWRDMRIWATLLIVFQLVIYSIF